MTGRRRRGTQAQRRAQLTTHKAARYAQAGRDMVTFSESLPPAFETVRRLTEQITAQITAAMSVLTPELRRLVTFAVSTDMKGTADEVTHP